MYTNTMNGNQVLEVGDYAWYRLGGVTVYCIVASLQTGNASVRLLETGTAGHVGELKFVSLGQLTPDAVK